MISSREDAVQDIATVETRLSRLKTVEGRLAKLNFALMDLALAERKHQLKLIRSARSYVEMIAAEPVQGMRIVLRTLDNELISMDEGIRSNVVRMSDLVLTGGVDALKRARELTGNATERLTVLKAMAVGGSGGFSSGNGFVDPNAQEIDLNQESLQKVPDFGDKEFLLHRVPVTFSSTDRSSKVFTKVGYVNVESLTKLGFKAATIGGYTVLKNQLAVGINPNILYDEGEDNEGKTVKVRQKVLEHKQVTKHDKVEKVRTRRERSPYDEALAVVKTLQKRTGTKYTFMSERGISFRKGTWFWIMPDDDVRRFARAFPGGRVDIRFWGFAGREQ